MILFSVSDSEFEGTLCRLCGLLSSYLEEEELRNLELIKEWQVHVGSNSHSVSIYYNYVEALNRLGCEFIKGCTCKS